MADTTLPGVLLTGNHAGRPTATDVATGTLYACSTHSLLYQSDGATWSTWATLGGGAPAAHAASHEDGGLDEIDVTGLAGAGGGGSSVLPLGMPYGTLDRSYTFDSTVESWTTTGGTLSSTGSKLRLALGAAGPHIALEPSGATNIADGELQFDGKIVSGADIHAVFRATDANNLYLIEMIEQGSASRGIKLYKRVAGTFTPLGSTFQATLGHLRLENDGQTYKFMVRFVGSQIDAYLNNTHIASWFDATHTTGDIGIACGSLAACTVDVDNVRVYSITTETQGAPGTGARV